MSELERIVENVAIEAWHEGTQRHDVARHAAIEAVKRCVEEVRDSTCPGDKMCGHLSCAALRLTATKLLTRFPEAKEESDD